MLRTPLILLSIALLSLPIGCKKSGVGKATTPQQCLQHFAQAAENEDILAMGKCFAPPFNTMFEGVAQLSDASKKIHSAVEAKFGKDAAKNLGIKKFNSTAKFTGAKVTYSDIQVNGNEATAQVTMARGDKKKSEKFQLEKINGYWKIGDPRGRLKVSKMDEKSKEETKKAMVIMKKIFSDLAKDLSKVADDVEADKFSKPEEVTRVVKGHTQKAAMSMMAEQMKQLKKQKK